MVGPATRRAPPLLQQQMNSDSASAIMGRDAQNQQLRRWLHLDKLPSEATAHTGSGRPGFAAASGIVPEVECQSVGRKSQSQNHLCHQHQQ